MILLEKRRRRRRRRIAARLPIYGPAVTLEAVEGTGAVRQSLALSREVVEHFRAMGPGWQARIDEVLKFHVRDAEERARRRTAERRSPRRRRRRGWRRSARATTPGRERAAAGELRDSSRAAGFWTAGNEPFSALKNILSRDGEADSIPTFFARSWRFSAAFGEEM